MKQIEWPFYKTDFLLAQGFSPTFVSRFWEKVKITESCWIWTGSRYLNHYGQFGTGYEGDSNIGAHVASWIIHRGPIPNGFIICHTCDNPPCVRPDHLFLGTHKTNSDDKIAKGRLVVGRRYRGEHQANSKLKEKDVGEILSLLANGSYPIAVLAEKFSVSPSLIRAIDKGLIWRHMQRPS